MSKNGAVLKWLTSFGFGALETMESVLLLFLVSFIPTEEASELANRSGKSPILARKKKRCLCSYLTEAGFWCRWGCAREVWFMIKTSLCKTNFLLWSAVSKSSLGVEKRRLKSSLPEQLRWLDTNMINPLRANYCHTWHMANHPCLRRRIRRVRRIQVCMARKGLSSQQEPYHHHRSSVPNCTTISVMFSCFHKLHNFFCFNPIQGRGGGAHCAPPPPQVNFLKYLQNALSYWVESFLLFKWTNFQKNHLVFNCLRPP